MYKKKKKPNNNNNIVLTTPYTRQDLDQERIG